MSPKKFKLLPKLDSEQVKSLINLSGELHYSYSTGSNRRVGSHEHERLSLYWYSKWFKWTSSQRDIFYKHHHKFAVDRSIQSWFLKFDANSGFLDDMDAWVDDPTPSTIVSVALYDNQKIILDGEEVTLNKGEGVQFLIDVIHSVPESTQDQLWACVMLKIPVKSKG